MTNSEIVAALNYLVPDAEWVLRGDDYANIEWIAGAKPTDKEIADTVDRLPEIKAAAETAAKAKREAALTKLAALGLTTDDLSALGL